MLIHHKIIHIQLKKQLQHKIKEKIHKLDIKIMVKIFYLERAVNFVKYKK